MNAEKSKRAAAAALKNIGKLPRSTPRKNNGSGKRPRSPIPVSVFTLSPRAPRNVGGRTAKNYFNAKVQQSLAKNLPQPKYPRNYLNSEYNKLKSYPRHGYIIARTNKQGKPIKTLVNIDSLFDSFVLINPRQLNVNALLNQNNKKNAGYVARLFRNALNYIGQIRKKEKNIHDDGLFYYKIHNKGANRYKIHRGKVGHDLSTKKLFVMKAYVTTSSRNEQPRNNIRLFVKEPVNIQDMRNKLSKIHI